MTKDEKLLLEYEIKLLEDSRKMLAHSYDACIKIGFKDTYTIEELDCFEALTSRFARTSDILIQKIFRLVEKIELERQGSIIDRINGAEKRGLIESAETFKEIRRIRNEIAHEYMPKAIEEIFKSVLRLVPYVLDSIERVKSYFPQI